MGLLYFAYGSNLLTPRLVKRCKTAKPFRPALAPGWGVGFRKEGMDGSAKATLFPDAGGLGVAGMLFHLDEGDLAVLDTAEGPLYERGPLTVTDLANPEREHAAISYVARTLCDTLKPYDWYHALIRAGGEAHRLPAQHLAWLDTAETMPDPETLRPGRLIALDALRAAGCEALIATLG